MSIPQWYKDTIIYDAHGCPPFSEDASLLALKRYKNSGINFLSLNVGFGNMTSLAIFSVIERFQKFIAKYSSDYCLIKTTQDIYLCKHENKIGIAFDLEGLESLAGDLNVLDRYYDEGVRQSLLVYNKNNVAGGGCDDDDHGLSAYGKKIISKMNVLGMIVDCSHTGKKTSLEIMDISINPVIFSHSNPYALCEHPRNISDEQIKACARTNGVIGINGIGIFLGKNNTTTIRIVEHIDYVVQLVGPQHVGIGLDYVFDHFELKTFVEKNTTIFPVEQGYHEVNLASPEQFPEIAVSLMERGYSEKAIRGILGENFMRVAQAVWK